MRFPGSEGSDSSGSTSGYPGILDMLQSAFDDDSDNDDSDVEMEQCPHRGSANNNAAASGANGSSGTPFGDNNTLVHQNSQNSTNSKKERKVSRLQRRFHRHNIYSEQIKTDQLKCLSLPRLLTEERARYVPYGQTPLTLIRKFLVPSPSAISGKYLKTYR